MFTISGAVYCILHNVLSTKHILPVYDVSALFWQALVTHKTLHLQYDGWGKIVDAD